MTTVQIQLVACVAATLVTFTATDVQAQQGGASTAPTNIQATLAADVATMSEKFAGLARVMVGKYDWRPGQGVRSVSDVFNLIVDENRMLNSLLTGGTDQGQGGGMGGDPPVTDPIQMQSDLTSTYGTLQQTIAGLSDDDLRRSVRIFGLDMSTQAAILLVLSDQHEHLGQSIAYARSVAVVPPWSK